MTITNRILIIAEAGVNHNSDIKLAHKMIDVAKEAGADVVKFQTFVPEDLVAVHAPKAEYQKQTTNSNESQVDMLKKLSLPGDAFLQLKKHCDEAGIEFCSTPFDLKSIDTLVPLKMRIMKIPSSEITNLPYLRKIGALNSQVIFSAGMATLGEIEACLNTLVESGTDREKIAILHCNSEYPTPFQDVNLKAMITIRDAFHVKTGFSDHTPGIEIPIAAAALGASIIEKHFTLDKKMEGPDHRASLDPTELTAMVRAIRIVEMALGTGIKQASPSELRNRPIARKSLVAATPIKKGEILSAVNMTTKRPGTGISPMEWDVFIGRPAVQDYNKDDFIVR